MPSMLQVFARKLGGEATPQVYRDIMRFVYKHRRDIASRFQNNATEAADEVDETRVQSEDNMPLGEKIGNWLPNVELSDDEPTEPTEPPHVDHSGDDEQLEDDRSQDDLLPEQAVYREVITNSSAYTWLLSAMRRQLLFSVPGSPSHRMADISSTIFSHEAFNRVSRKTAPPSCSVVFVVVWDPIAFFRDQGFDQEPRSAVETALTLTGIPTEVEALGCGDYLRRTWPQSGQAFLELLRAVLSSEARVWHNVQLGDGTTIQASAQKPEFVVNATGPPDTVVEIGEQLAWVASAFRLSDHRVASVTPSVRRVLRTGQTSSSVSMTVELAFFVQPEEKKRENGDCWQTLFSASSAVQGYPTRQRPGPVNGLEMDVGLMAALVETGRITTFKGRPFIKGFCTMLFAVNHVRGLVLWHVLANEDGRYIEYHDPRVPSFSQDSAEMESIPSIPELKKARHVVGWCSSATSEVGRSTANFSIRGSNLGSPGAEFAFEKVTVGGGQFATVSTTIALANRHRPPQPRAGDDYIRKLRMLCAIYVVLFDVEERRAWLVDGASALLHLLRKSLLVDQSNGLNLLHQHEHIQDQDQNADMGLPSGALRTLQSYRDLTIYENAPDITIETKTKPSGETEEVTITKRTWYRVKDRVGELYSNLEEIIAHQTDLSSQNGVGFKVRRSPRRQLEGFDFLDLASSAAPIWPKTATLKTTGWGWVDLARALHAITLFGRGFGSLLRPENDDSINPGGTGAACPAWTEMPSGHDHLGVSTVMLRVLLDSKGDRTQTPWRLTDNIYLHTPDMSFEPCDCIASGSQNQCDRVQSLLPLTFLYVFRSFLFASPVIFLIQAASL
ncbi:hypothetical protein GQ53DRAFT_272153 [Thozetella sp. PMI_491]|nr:hypothetical protein GQ53DRAFT_272153 [Thozetella sp. PMI_491]